MANDPVVGFDDLVSVASRLNSSSDDLTNALRIIEDNLNTLALGIERFVAIPDTRVDLGDERRQIEAWEEDHLGYSRIGDRWGFVVRHTKFVDEQDLEAPPEDCWTFEDQKPLLKASRETRIQAAPAIPLLFAELKGEADRILNIVESARRLAGRAEEHPLDELRAAFIKASRPENRDQIAFEQFLGAYQKAARAYIGRPAGLHDDEYNAIANILQQLFVEILPRVEFIENLTCYGEGIGLAMRAGILPASGEALAQIKDAKDFVDFANRGFEISVEEPQPQGAASNRRSKVTKLEPKPKGEA